MGQGARNRTTTDAGMPGVVDLAKSASARVGKIVAEKRSGVKVITGLIVPVRMR
jgi:hypothetical protein